MTKVFFLLVFSWIYLFAYPKEDIEFKYYYISPKKSSEVEKELFIKTPIRMKGKRFLGSTWWNVKYKLKTQYNSAYCKIDIVKVTLKVKYTMPKVSSSTPKAISYKFDRYYKKLMTHEENHKNNGLKAAIEIEKKLRKMKKEKNCKTLYNKAKKMASSVIKKYNRLDKLYDQRTQHGKSEGVSVGNYF